MTPSNSCLGLLEAENLSKLDTNWTHISGGKPTKELPLHRAYYESRPKANAVVHLHTTFATAVSCLSDVDPEDASPPITPYMVMRLACVPVLPYTAPGSSDVTALIAARGADHAAVLLANHRPVVAGTSLDSAVFNGGRTRGDGKIDSAYARNESPSP